MRRVEFHIFVKAPCLMRFSNGGNSSEQTWRAHLQDRQHPPDLCSIRRIRQATMPRLGEAPRHHPSAISTRVRIEWRTRSEFNQTFAVSIGFFPRDYFVPRRDLNYSQATHTSDSQQCGGAYLEDAVRTTVTGPLGVAARWRGWTGRTSTRLIKPFPVNITSLENSWW